MANTLTNLIPDMYKALDVVSRELVGFIPAVSRDSGAEQVAVGQTVNVPVVGAETASDITPGTTPPDDGDMDPANVDVTISKSKYVPIRWTGEEQKGVMHTGIYDNVNQARFAQAFRTLNNLVETDIAAQHLYASRAYGTSGTVPFTTANDLTDASFALKILNDNGAPDDRHIVLGTTATAQLQGKQPGLFQVNTSGDGGRLLRTGAVGDLFNASLHTSGQVTSHTAGTASGATTDATGYAVGSTTITLANAGSGTILAGDAISFAGDSEKYMVITGDANVTDGGTVVIAEPGLMQAIPASATAITVSATSERNMVFSRSAIALATRAPEMPKEGDMAVDVVTVQDPISGLAYQVALYPQYRRVKYEVGLAWGYKVIAPRHVGVLLG